MTWQRPSVVKKPMLHVSSYTDHLGRVHQHSMDVPHPPPIRRCSTFATNALVVHLGMGKRISHQQILARLTWTLRFWTQSP